MLTRFALAVVTGAAALVAVTQAKADVYTDAVGDISPSIFSGNGVLDITGMEVTNTATDLVFKLSVNGNVATTDWGKFMVGIGRVGGSGTTSGNGWGRPINMSTPSGGMTNWLGGWTDSGGGAESYVYGGSSWSLVGATWAGSLPGSFSISAGSISSVTWTISMASMGLSVGDTFYFDAYTSGGGGGDGAIDALANPNVTVSGWTDSYTSSQGSGLYSYTVVPAPGALALLGLAGAAGSRRRKA